MVDQSLWEREGQRWEVTANGHGVSFWNDDSILKSEYSKFHNPVNILNTIELYTYIYLNTWNLWYKLYPNKVVKNSYDQ